MLRGPHHRCEPPVTASGTPPSRCARMGRAGPHHAARGTGGRCPAPRVRPASTSSSQGRNGRWRDHGAPHGRDQAAGAGEEQGPGDVERRGAARGPEAHQGRGRRARPLLVHRPRGPPQVLRDHAERDGGRAQRRHGLRRLVDHGLQPDRGVRHGRDPRSGDVRAHAAPRRRARPRARLEGRPHDLRRRQARRLARTRAIRATSSSSRSSG